MYFASVLDFFVLILLISVVYFCYFGCFIYLFCFVVIAAAVLDVGRGGGCEGA